MKVVIVGAGPAGLITALNLTKKGIKPLVLEKNRELKSTACAEGCSLIWLNKVPFDSKPYIAKKVSGAKIIFSGGAVDHIPRACAVLDRTRWLNGIAREVELNGGEVRLNSAVVAVDKDHLRLKNGNHLAYTTLIDASGPNSIAAKYLGIKYQYITASQYRLAANTSNMNELEFYLDKKFSYGYAWIFPKNGVINVGLGGDFALLDDFLRYRGLDSYPIIDRGVGIIPASGIQQLVEANIALIGDAASMPNPLSMGGLAPIICASRILVENINNLANYQREIKRHPIANPILLEAARNLVKLTEPDIAHIGRFLSEIKPGTGRSPSLNRIAKYPRLVLKLNQLKTLYQAGRIAVDYGW
ncbi:MAG: NAD(P)/FAD-dependent oxidoreductase [Dehalococcoidales bacterium]|nr:NAD(P)/FAD-dependent oxidoreductase [Dehalococcoidales bacterium]